MINLNYLATLRLKANEAAHSASDSLANFLDSGPGKITTILAASAGLALILRSVSFGEENKSCQASYRQLLCSDDGCSVKERHGAINPGEISDLLNGYNSGKIRKLKIYCD